MNKNVYFTSKRLIHNYINIQKYPELSTSSSKTQKEEFYIKGHNDFNHGFLHLPNFINNNTIQNLKSETIIYLNTKKTYRSVKSFNVYLKDNASDLLESSSKVVISKEDIPKDSIMAKLYNSHELLELISKVVMGIDSKSENKTLYKSDDPKGAFYYNYFFHGDSLGFHFDNSEFFINIVVQNAIKGGVFEYVYNLRSQDNNNIEEVKEVYNKRENYKNLQRFNDISEGSLVVFRGRYSLHRVTPVIGLTPRINSILTFERKPGVKLEDYTRKKFFGEV